MNGDICALELVLIVPLVGKGCCRYIYRRESSWQRIDLMGLLTTIYSLLRREYRSLPRQSWFHLRRTILPAMGILLFWMVFMPSIQGMAPPGMRLFQLLSIMTAMGAFVIAMHATGYSLIRDRTHGNLELILLTDMPPWHYAIGKFTYGVTRGIQAIAVLMPIGALGYGMGGYNKQSVLGAAGIILVTTLLGAACGLLASVIVRDPLHIRILSALVGLTIYVIVPGVAVIVSIWVDQADGPMLVALSPFSCLMHIHDAGFLKEIVEHLIGSTLLAMIILFLGCLRLPSTFSKPEGEPDTIIGEISNDFAATQTMRMLLERPLIEGNPVIWRDLHVLYGGEKISWAKLIVITMLLAGTVTGIGIAAGIPGARIPMWVWIFMTIFYGAIFCYGLLLNTSKAFDRERQDHSIDLLLSSDLNGKELVVGKLISILHTHAPYGVAWLICLFILLSNMSMTPMIATLLGILQFAFILASSATISLFLAARLSSTWNLAIFTIGYCIIWLGVLMAFPLANGLLAYMILSIMTVSYHGYLTFVCWRYLTLNCRAMLLDLPDLKPHQQVDEEVAG